MTILIDPPTWPAHGTVWSHLVSDRDAAELHAFAKRLGIPRRGFDLDHYDVPASLTERAIALGARPVSAREVLQALRDSGQRVRQVDRPVMAPVRRRQYLAAEWAELGPASGVRPARTDAWARLGEDLLARWAEPHRSYHSEEHLEDVLLALDQLGTRGERVPPETLLAAWFHDAVYSGAADDEAASARLAREALDSAGLDAALAERVAAFVAETAPARAVQDPEHPLALLLDADLAIFAASKARYERYSQAVRTEYAHVPAADFARGRSEILRGYLDRPAVYRTEAARNLWESRARANLAAELAALASG